MEDATTLEVGTDVAGFMTGRAGTGKRFEMSGIYVFRAAGGRLKELWQEADVARVLKQLVPA